jgi:uncharacterized protein (TIGR03083 family)
MPFGNPDAVRGPNWEPQGVPTDLPLARHLAGVGSAMVAFVRYADRAGLSAPVPTCPDWTVRDLVAHQGMVHRWAAGLLRGETGIDPDAFEAEGRSELDPLEWLRDGVIELAETVSRASEDARAPVFLNDAPRPREFWARRQCHETTVHAVDALAAALGRLPEAEETWIDVDVAVDGIDELLGGFLTRPRSRLRCEEDAVLVVAPDDAPDWWRVELGPRPAVSIRRTGPRGSGDWVLDGPAVELYLALWNRTARAGLDAGWRERAAVAWR